MTDSSDDEIIQRKRPNIRKPQYVSDSSISEGIVSDSEAMEGDFEPLFFEIFGNGDEYNYIYKEKKEEKNENTIILNEISPSDCFNYISKYYSGFKSIFQGLTQKCVKDLIDGYSPEYLAFHMNQMTVKELYYTKHLIEEFRKYSSHSNRSVDLDTYTSVVLYNGIQPNINFPGILNISEYMQNLINYECVITPRERIDVPFSFSASSSRESGWGDDDLPFLEFAPATIQNFSASDIENLLNFFKKIISQISSNSLFIDRVFKSKTVELLDLDNSRSSTFSLRFLQKLFCSGNGGTDDMIRNFIIEQAYNSVNINKRDIERPLITSGLINGPNSLQEIVNIIVSMQGKPGSYAGIYYDLGLFSVVKIDDLGNVTNTSVFRDFQTPELQVYLQDVNNVILSSSTPNVKYLMQNTDINFMYLPKKFSLFNDQKELSIPYCIALAVQNPVLYFSKVLYNLRNRITVNFTSEFSIADQSLLERAIFISCAMHKLDWKATLQHKFGYTFFNILQINLTDKNLNVENLNKLENLAQVFDEVKYANVCTFFNLEDSDNSLDKTYVHPNNYSKASTICLGAYHKLLNDASDAILNYEKFDIYKDQAKITEVIVNQPELIQYFKVPAAMPEDEKVKLTQLKNIIMRSKEITFSGSSDLQIFNDVVPHIEQNKEYSGTISKIGTDFFLCNVNNATVYVKKACELSTNQIVKIKVISKTPDMLSYEGVVNEEENTVVDRFRTHPLFKCLDQRSLEKYMELNSHTVLIRPSSTTSHCVVVCKLDNELFYSIKLKECYENAKFCYEFKDKKYPSIDNFIETYVRPIYLHLSKVMSFKYYFKTQREALEYLHLPGEYVKYCVLLSKEALGYLEFLILGKKFYVKLDGSKLAFKNHSFNSLEEMISFLKMNNSKF